MADPVKWAEEHPYATAGIIFVGGLGLLWLFGFFGGSSSSSADTASTNMASAYYAAEAAQATAGTQLNMQQDIDQAATAQTALQTGAAVSINAVNATASQNIATSMYGASTTIATTQSNDALASSVANGAYAAQIAEAGDQANESITAMQTLIPQELATYGMNAFKLDLPGGTTYQTTGPAGGPNAAAAAGFTPAQIAAMFG
jgi:hypothetical protein